MHRIFDMQLWNDAAVLACGLALTSVAAVVLVRDAASMLLGSSKPSDHVEFIEPAAYGMVGALIVSSVVRRSY